MSDLLRLFLAYFISQAGSHFLTLALSAFILASTGSLTHASLVFVFSFFPSVLVSRILGKSLDVHASRTLYVSNELASIFLTILVGALISYQAPIGLICAVLSVRSIMGFVSRVLAMKRVKELSPVDKQAANFKILQLSYFLSTAVSGVFVSFVLVQGGIKGVILIDISSYLFSALILLTMKNWAEQSCDQTVNVNLESVVYSGLEPNVLFSAFGVVFSQALFQGAYSVYVNAIPVKVLGIGLSGVGLFQIAASLGIILGFVFVWRFSSLTNRIESKGTALILAIFGLLCSGVLLSPKSALIAFFLMNFGFEVFWLTENANVFQKSPKNRIAQIQFQLSAYAALLMSAQCYLYARLAEKYGVAQSALFGASILSLFILVPATFAFIRKRIYA